MSSKALFKGIGAKEFFHYLKKSSIKSFACRIKPGAAGRVTEPATASLVLRYKDISLTGEEMLTCIHIGFFFFNLIL